MAAGASVITSAWATNPLSHSFAMVFGRMCWAGHFTTHRTRWIGTRLAECAFPSKLTSECGSAPSTNFWSLGLVYLVALAAEPCARHFRILTEMFHGYGFGAVAALPQRGRARGFGTGFIAMHCKHRARRSSLLLPPLSRSSRCPCFL